MPGSPACDRSRSRNSTLTSDRPAARHCSRAACEGSRRGAAPPSRHTPWHAPAPPTRGRCAATVRGTSGRTAGRGTLGRSLFLVEKRLSHGGRVDHARRGRSTSIHHRARSDPPSAPSRAVIMLTISISQLSSIAGQYPGPWLANGARNRRPPLCVRSTEAWASCRSPKSVCRSLAGVTHAVLKIASTSLHLQAGQNAPRLLCSETRTKASSE